MLKKTDSNVIPITEKRSASERIISSLAMSLLMKRFNDGLTIRIPSLGIEISKKEGVKIDRNK